MASVVALAAAACLRRIWATDFWWQFATGRFVAQHGWPATDPFSSLVPGAEWVEMRWLYCLVQYSLMQYIGSWAVVVTKGLVVCAAFSLVALPFVRRLHPVVTSAVLTVAILASTQRLLVRPELVHWLFLAAFVFVLDHQRRKGGRAIYLLPLLQVVWANAHPSFVFGPLLVAMAAVALLAEALVRREPPRGPALRTYAVVFVSCIVVNVVNPYGLRGLLVPFEVFAQMRGSIYKEAISEYISPFTFGFAHTAVVYYELLIAICLASAVLNLRRLDPFWLLFCVSQFYLSTMAIRNLPLFALAAVPFVLSNLERSPVASRLSARTLRRGRNLLAVASIVCGVWSVQQIVTDRFSVRQNDSKQSGLGVAHHRYPVEAAAFLDRVGFDGRVYATLLESSYLISRGRQVFADPRGDFYDNAQFRHYLTLQQDAAAWRAAAREYDLRAALVSLTSGFLDLLQRDPEWRLVFFDPVAAVYVRADSLGELEPIETGESFDRALSVARATLPAPVNYRDAGPFTRVSVARPYLSLAEVAIRVGRLPAAESLLAEAEIASPFVVGLAHRRAAIHQARREWPAVLEQARAALTETPDDAQLLFAIAQAEFHLGRHGEAETRLQDALTRHAGDAKSWDLLGRIAMLRSDYAEAAVRLARAVRLSPAVVTYRNNLARALAASGRGTEAISELEEARRLAPRNVTVLRDLAILLFGQGRPERALPYADEALALAPADPDLRRLRDSIAAATKSSPG